MKLENRRQIEEALWKELASLRQSPSHDHWHIDRVLAFAHLLSGIYGGDERVLSAAGMLHDLGRDDPTKHGDESIAASLKEAEEVLTRAELNKRLVDETLRAIDEHDKPEVVPSTLEGKILKEADFLAGFGAWGILRICMWAGETGKGVSQVLDRLRNRMPRRLQSMHFREGKEFAESSMRLARFFLSEIERPPQLCQRTRNWIYIVFEGISGTGKDTQIRRLESRLRDQGRHVIIHREPSECYKTLRDQWREFGGRDSSDPSVQLFLLLATRYESFLHIAESGLKDDTVVLGNRSYLSSLVYQSSELFGPPAIALLHRFAPQPDLVLLLDIEPEKAYARIRDRGNLGEHEQVDSLRLHRPLFLKLLREATSPEGLEVINADMDESKVEDAIWKCVSGFVGPAEANAGVGQTP